MSKTWGEIREEALRKCGQLPPKTNYDRLRAKSVEEMAEFFMREYDGEDLFTCPVPHPCPTSREASCKQCFLDWLKREGE